MSKCISQPRLGFILDRLHRNYTSESSVKSLKELSADCQVSVPVISKVRNILMSMGVLIIEGDRTTQRCYWNVTRSTPNPVMLAEVYRAYTRDSNSRVKVKIKKREPQLPSIELALLALKQEWDSIILRKDEKYSKTTKFIDLSKIGE